MSLLLFPDTEEKAWWLATVESLFKESNQNHTVPLPLTGSALKTIMTASVCHDLGIYIYIYIYIYLILMTSNTNQMWKVKNVKSMPEANEPKV